MIKRDTSPITLDSKLCCRCNVCYSVCPFEAISLNQDKIPEIDLEKCMLCGICPSACPSGIIKIIDYNTVSLVSELKTKKTPETINLIIACRGSTAPDCTSLDEFAGQNPGKSVFMRVPCVGRVPAEFYLNALSLGIRKVVALQCMTEFCRFDKGSATNYRRISALNRMIASMGYEDGTITVIDGAKQIEYDTTSCVGCDKCVQICPYQAIEPQPLATPKINYDKCTGCGACAVVCPHLALEIGGYECKQTGELIKSYGEKIRETKSGAPSILVFCCQWAEFANLNGHQPVLYKPNVALIEIPCFSKLDPVNILQGFQCGFDGVLAITCSDTECKSRESRNTAEDNMMALNSGLKIACLENRFRVHKTSPKKVGDFNREIDSFTEAIRRLEKAEETSIE